MIEPELVSPAFRGIENLRHDRHGNFFTGNNQWFYAFNDKGRPGRGEFFRDSCLSYVHFREDGSMEPIRLDSTGVGQYDLTQGPVDARDFFAAGDTFLSFPNVYNLKKNASLLFLAASGNPKGTELEVREKTIDGPLLGKISVPFTGGWDQFRTIECGLINTARVYNLCLVCRSGWKSNLTIQSFS